MTRRSIIVGLREEEIGLEPKLEPCWTMLVIGLVQCEPGEPCWIWTQTWVQARMPDYSLNRTKRTNVIQCCQRHHRPPKAESLSAANLSLIFNTAPGRSPAAESILVAASCAYIASAATTLLGQVKCFCTLKVSLLNVSKSNTSLYFEEELLNIMYFILWS